MAKMKKYVSTIKHPKSSCPRKAVHPTDKEETDKNVVEK